MEIESIINKVVIEAEKKKADEPENLLWEDEFTPADELEDFIAVSMKYPSVVSKLKPGTKVFEKCTKSVKQITNGDFLCCYNWSPDWVTKIMGMNPGICDVKFDRKELVRKVEEILEYCSVRKVSGFWYPGDGKKCNLADFLVSQRRDGRYWSPFIELSVSDCMTPDDYRKQLGDDSEYADKVLSNVYWPVDFNSSKTFFNGVLRLKKWWEYNYTNLTATPENRLVFSSFSRFLNAIVNFNNKYKCIGRYFIGPNDSKWESLISYLKKEYNVV